MTDSKGSSIDPSNVQELLQSFKQLSSRPENFLLGDPASAQEFKNLAKQLYDFGKNFGASQRGSRFTNGKALPELYVKDFDHVAIWEQLNLDRASTLRGLAVRLSETEAKNAVQKRFRHQLRELEKKRAELKAIQESQEKMKSISKREKKIVAEKPSNTTQISDKGPNEKTSIVDDQFFKLSEMEEFLEMEEQREEKDATKKDESSDEEDEEDEEKELDNYSAWFEEGDDDEEGEEAQYEDFFGPKESKVSQAGEKESPSSDESSESDEDFDDGELDIRDVDESDVDEGQKHLNETLLNPASSSEEESDGEGESVQQILGQGADKGGKDDPTHLSKFEKEQEDLKEKIKRLEQQNVTVDKPWHLKGEVQAQDRPENSLLGQVLQYDTATRPAPIITEETTRSIEEIIKQRVKDEAWDDVERKTKPSLQPFEYRKRLLLNEEKSKVSLAEIYEKEYTNQQKSKEEDETQTDPKHEEIKVLLRSLFLQLDALSAFNFTPRPPEPQLKIINNLPAVSIEEAIPEAVSDAKLLAPQEVYEKPKGEVKADTEKDSTDKKRLRRIKKKKQHLRKLKLEQEGKLPKLKGSSIAKNKYVQLEGKKKLKEAKSSKLSNEADADRSSKNALKSSTAFFSKLQEQVENQVNLAKNEKRSSDLASRVSTKKLKL